MRIVSKQNALGAAIRYEAHGSQPHCRAVPDPLRLAILHKDRRTAARAVEPFEPMAMGAHECESMPLAVVRVVVAALPSPDKRNDPTTSRTDCGREQKRKDRVSEDGAAAEEPQPSRKNAGARLTANRKRDDDDHRDTHADHPRGECDPGTERHLEPPLVTGTSGVGEAD